MGEWDTPTITIMQIRGGVATQWTNHRLQKDRCRFFEWEDEPPRESNYQHYDRQGFAYERLDKMQRAEREQQRRQAEHEVVRVSFRLLVLWPVTQRVGAAEGSGQQEAQAGGECGGVHVARAAIRGRGRRELEG
jgi:hypothetical protein